MKTILKLFILLCCCAQSAWAGYGVVDAINSGYISVSASSSVSYSEAKLVVKNLKSYAVDVDFSTAWFVQNNTSQRVGLAYEKSSGSYYLRLAAGKTYTLYFSSRCLDHSRSAPSSGVSFTKIYTISSQFSQIINALRNNYSQASVWQLTDDSGSFSQSWKNADPRAPVGGGGTTTGIDLSGAVSWSTSGSYINIKAAKVQNLSSTSTSGSLRLRIWATRSRYTGGTITGYILGTRSLNPLNPGYYYSNISGNVSYSRPPTGAYYTTITVEEYTNSGWVIRDYVNFSGTSSF